MNIAQRAMPFREGGITALGDIADLRPFAAPDCAAAVVARQVPRDVLDGLGSMDPAILPRGRVVVQPQGVGTVVAQLCDIAKMPKGAIREWLEADIATLAKAFAEMMDAQYLRVRLDVITTNACRRFHVDAISARLICTYRGTGTQYGLQVNHADPEAITTVPTGVPILLRGSLWPPKPASGLVHRSPPIEGTGETRLVLVIDAVNDPEGAG